MEYRQLCYKRMTSSLPEISTSVPNSMISVFGEMVWLYSVSPLQKSWHISSIQRWLVPALAHKQYRIYHRGEKPVGLVTWAYLNEKVEKRYALRPTSLEPKDWNSGDRKWIIDFIAPFGDALKIGHDLRTNVFPDEIGRILQMKTGVNTMEVAYVHGVNAAAKSRDRRINPSVL